MQTGESIVDNANICSGCVMQTGESIVTIHKNIGNTNLPRPVTVYNNNIGQPPRRLPLLPPLTTYPNLSPPPRRPPVVEPGDLDISSIRWRGGRILR